MQYNDILYTTDNKYIDVMLCSIYTLIKNGNLKNMRIHIVCENFEYEDYCKVENFFMEFNDISLYIYPLEPFECNIPKWRGSHVANARLFYPKIIKKNFTNATNLLYLDSDTLVANGIELEKYKNHLINACDDLTAKSYKKSLHLNHYYNSGVLYINLDKWVDDKINKKIHYFINHNNQPLKYPDQDIINLVLQEDINKLPYNYNIGTYPFFFNDYQLKLLCHSRHGNINYEEIKEAKENPIILHSYELLGIKPWYQNNVNPFTEQYKDVLRNINTDFEFKELSGMRKILANNPSLLKSVILVRSYTNDKLVKNTKKLIKK